ncbi:MAG: ARMT1-like domain-containing protein [Chloroflexi bacterium]|nr:ARMT1-like domain-containing protein [Chloroflexota bacterium]
MKLTPAICLPCTMTQATRAIGLSAAQDSHIPYSRIILRQMADYLSEEISSAYFGAVLHRSIQQLTGVADPFVEMKTESNLAAAQLLERLDVSSLTFSEIVTLATAANAIDFGLVKGLEELDIAALAHERLALYDEAELESRLKEVDEVLYLLDNSGEVLFDGLLISALRKRGLRVVVGVKSHPILNDVTREDLASLPVEADEVVETGAGVMGVVEKESSPEFLQRLRSMRLVIAKGMGHYETLPEIDWLPPTAFLLKAKCGPVAEDLGVELGANVLKIHANGQTEV